jgi:tRNA (mo5U34)-methyltransferase
MVCLDIGTLDGPYAFELARRGAGVIGLDIQRPGATGFDAARAITGSTAEYIQGSAYELTELFDADIFDIVLFLDVWHHMKSPVVAFEQINAVMKKDGLLAAEGECLLNYLETSDDAHMLCQSETPLSIFYPAGYKGDSSSWVVPNAACVNAWLQATGFSKVHAAVEDLSPHQRIRITAVKSSEPKADNPLW